MEKLIPLSVPNFQGNELQYVTDAVSAGWVSTGGTYVNRFEKDIASYLHTPGAVACQSGTAALHISLLLCGVTREDAVLVPALTFIAAVNPVAYVGAEPIFMDCDAHLCLDPVKLETFCREECHVENGHLIENATGRCVKAMVVVHVFGDMADMEALMRVAEAYNILVIEDATEAIGTYYTQGRFAGKFAGTIGTIGALSFNGNKIVTTGGGGMIISMDESLLAHAKHLTTQAKADELYYIHDEIGYNYRMTNVQAALGVAQMEQLDTFIETKWRNYAQYRQEISETPGLRLLDVRENTRSNRWFYALYLEDEYSLNRDELIQHLAKEQIQARPIWGLICDQKPYSTCRQYQIDSAREYYRHVVNIPCSTNLTSEDVARVALCLKGR